MSVRGAPARGRERDRRVVQRDGPDCGIRGDEPEAAHVERQRARGVGCAGPHGGARQRDVGNRVRRAAVVGRKVHDVALRLRARIERQAYGCAGLCVYRQQRAVAACDERAVVQRNDCIGRVDRAVLLADERAVVDRQRAAMDACGRRACAGREHVGVRQFDRAVAGGPERRAPRPLVVTVASVSNATEPAPLASTPYARSPLVAIPPRVMAILPPSRATAPIERSPVVVTSVSVARGRCLYAFLRYI